MSSMFRFAYNFNSPVNFDTKNVTDIDAYDVFGNIIPNYLEFSGLMRAGDEIKIDGFSGDYKVEEQGVVVAEKKANEAFQFNDNTHYKVYLQSGEGIPENNDTDDKKLLASSYPLNDAKTVFAESKNSRIK